MARTMSRNLSRRWMLIGIPFCLLFILLLVDWRFPSARARLLPGWIKTNSHSKPRRTNNFQYVDPLIGTLGGGHVFPGATLPFGMAKASPDVMGENQGGFGSDGSDVYGFSALHDLGVGWIPSLGNFPLMPMLSCTDNTSICNFDRVARHVKRQNGSAIAKPGYFSIVLDNGITAEMTVTSHTALYRFKFNSTRIDESFGEMIYIGLESLHRSYVEGFLVVDKSSGRVKGNGSFTPSFGIGNYDAYFCADFSGTKVKTAEYSEPQPHQRRVADNTTTGSSTAFGAWVQFEPSEEILARMGMSFISYEQACRNAEAEISSFDFEKTRAEAEVAWEDKFAVVEVDTDAASTEMLTLFWTGIYRSMISPQDYTGENQLWDGDEPYYDSWYCIWDTFRTTHPLLVLLDQEAQTRMVRSLIDIYVHEGKLPDCRMSFCKGYTQGGSNADVVLADSLLKGISDNIDWNLGLEAALSDAEDYPYDWRVEGRGGIDDWRNLGYLPVDNSSGYSRSISRTVEYAYDDFCIAEMAHLLGHTMAGEMLSRSHNWENLFNEETASYLPGPNAETPTDGSKQQKGDDTGFTGFLQPKFLNKTFGLQDPVICSPLLFPNSCYLEYSTKGETYEGSVWLYTFLSSPSDMATVISKLGGDDTFVDRLDYFHESGLLYFGDEQSFLTAYLYHYAGRPGLSGQRVRSYIPSIFNTSVNGLPGNDDSGAMGAFTSLTMLGLFPNAGQDAYLIVPPFFKEISILNRSTGKKATIRALNFDGSHGENRYIQKAVLNGKPWKRSWVRHSFFLEGGTLELTLGPVESTWGRSSAARPPSTGRDGSWAFMDIK